MPTTAQYVEQENGWIFDSAWAEYISPSGRIADYPGAPFRGQLSKQEFEEVQKKVKNGSNINSDNGSTGNSTDATTPQIKENNVASSKSATFVTSNGKVVVRLIKITV